MLPTTTSSILLLPPLPLPASCTSSGAFGAELSALERDDDDAAAVEQTTHTHDHTHTENGWMNGKGRENLMN